MRCRACSAPLRAAEGQAFRLTLRVTERSTECTHMLHSVSGSARGSAAVGELIDAVVQPARHWTMDTSQSGPAVSGVIVTTSPVLRLAVAAYLARFKGQSRVHTDSDLRGYLIWCEDRQLDPFTATRPHIELYLRWLQEVRRFRPSTVSRRMSVVAGFYRTCVIDGRLDRSPAEHIRRPHVSAESPTLGLSHLQFEAMLTAARTVARAPARSATTNVGTTTAVGCPPSTVIRGRGPAEPIRARQPSATPPGANPQPSTVA